MIIQLVHIPKLAASIPLAEAYTKLNTAEKKTADTMTASTRLHEFVYGRYSLKMALAEHLNTHADGLELLKEPQGKLHLQHNPTFFNLTHSGEYIAFCISDEGPVGIDIEHIKKLKNNLLAIAKRYFTQAEYHALEQSDTKQQKSLFYKIWTLKEAALKATGLGISAGLDRLNALNIKPNQAYTLTLEKTQHQLWFNHWINPIGHTDTYLATALEYSALNDKNVQPQQPKLVTYSSFHPTLNLHD